MRQYVTWSRQESKNPLIVDARLERVKMDGNFTLMYGVMNPE